MSERTEETKQSYPRHVFQDCFTFHIPLHVTADLAPAIRHTRQKRLKLLHPPDVTSHSTNKLPEDSKNDTKEQEGEDLTSPEEETAEGNREEPKKSNKQRGNVPQRHEYSSILDYLEAKYVQGVQLDDDEEEDDEEGLGSIYSETSFLDDTDLKRNVAEQVLANTTTTKLELQDDDEFFVNVGNLEVEETEWTQEHYDPLQDVDANSNKKKKVNKKRKPAEEVSSSPKSKPKKPKTTAENNKKITDNSTSDLRLLQNQASNAEEKMEELYQKVLEHLNNASEQELPRKKTKERVSLVCPADKQPGDTILFSNPHVPGQRLKVKIPKNTAPGGTFKVTVPVAEPPSDDDTDHNKLGRVFYDILDEYARAFDDWCDAEGEYRKAAGDDKDYSTVMEKRKRFDKMVTEVPQDLKTPLDKAYLQKITRRARQNRAKREKLAAKDENEDDETVKSSKSKATEKKKTKVKKEPVVDETVDDSDHPKVLVPELATEFPTCKFNPADFA